ncbi:uncharacterized protein LOC116014783 isoform X1 [Ipomoea triloba]|uniref:uncharacterized protein LOC116014783 isoform X1 n=1 Tax=Ipomoea triloba TaxID=35885 RepID=UPI00125E7B04|nr:uncharacterized protein LOC116014783 isoform X1 [Ipomoea triloba]
MTIELKIIDTNTQTRNWSCKVRVIKINEPKNAIATPGLKYMLIVLEDENGTRVQVVVYDHDIEMYEMTLHTNSWYSISNATVKPSRSCYKVFDKKYNYSWTLNVRNGIQTIDNVDTALAPVEQVYTSFSEFYQRMKTSTEISIVAIVIDKLPKQFVSTTNGNQKINDFIVVDES